MNQQEDRTKAREEKTAEPSAKTSRLGKEAKIGAGVILVLLVVLGAVVVMRFAGPASNDPPKMADRDPGKLKPPGGLKDDPLFKDFNTKPEGRHPTTIVPAKAAAMKPPKSLDDHFDKWKLSSDKPEPKRVENRYGTPGSQPPLMPEPPKRELTRSDLPKSTGSRYDTPVIERNRSDMSGFAMAGSSPAATTPVPPHRERSRYGDDSAALLPPAAPPPDAPIERERPSRLVANDRFTPATPVARYGDDFRRPAAEPIYDRDEPRRHGSSSYGIAPPPLPRRNDGKYEVRPGDSYWKISENVYGVGSYFNALAEKNRAAVGDGQLTPGQFVMTPPVEELEKAYPELCPKSNHRETARDRATTGSTRPASYRSGKTYTVAEGDTLFAIARYELGKASRWVELYDLNRDVLGKDFNYLTPGMKLTLPDGGKSEDVLTRRPGSEFRR